jgi:hypothetical protein
MKLDIECYLMAWSPVQDCPTGFTQAGQPETHSAHHPVGKNTHTQSAPGIGYSGINTATVSVMVHNSNSEKPMSY